MHTLNRDIEGGHIWKKSKKDNSGTEFGHTWSKTGHPIGKLKDPSNNGTEEQARGLRLCSGNCQKYVRCCVTGY